MTTVVALTVMLSMIASTDSARAHRPNQVIITAPATQQAKSGTQPGPSANQAGRIVFPDGDQPTPNRTTPAAAAKETLAAAPAASATAAVAVAAPLRSKTQRIAFTTSPTEAPEGWKGSLDMANAAMLSPANAETILASLQHSSPHFIQEKTYYIFHIVRWSDTAENKQTVAKQNWYVFRPDARVTLEEFATNKRLYGTHRLALVAIHINKDKAIPYDMEYLIDVKKKDPANVVDLFAALQLFKPPAAEDAVERKQVEYQTVFGFMRPTEMWYGTSDISIAAKVTKAQGADETSAINPEAVVFDNEGLHRWDVSIAVPIRSVKEVQFDSVSNLVSAANPDRTKLMAVFDFYPAPVDIKNDGFSWIPYGLVGFGISGWNKQLLLGAGFGPAFAQFYVGLGLTKIQESSDPTVPKPGRWDYDKQLTFGINIPVRAAVAALNKTKTADSAAKAGGSK